MMKETITKYQFADRMARGDHGFTWAGAEALFSLLSDYEDDTGTELEFDPVAFRCEYSEYRTATEALGDLDGDALTGIKNDLADDDLEGDLDALEDEALRELERLTEVYPFSGGLIVRNY